jgi:hypothetical protein
MQNVIRKLSLATLLVIPLVTGAGCEAADKLKEAQGDLCCTDFKVGADLSNVDWGIEGEGKAEFSAFMQASADFSASASGLVLELGTLCQAVAVDMGADENEVKETDPGNRAAAWCNIVVTKIKAAGSISIEAQPPVCSISASAQANCEASCSGKAECQLQPGELPQCEGGEASFSCEGKCQGSCTGSADLAVTCEGSCSGTCEGSCEGTCEGKCNGTESSGQCQGTCEGTCSGSCAGKCRGSCKAEANANLECEGECSGSCEGTIKAPRCSGGSLPKAKCQVSADCSGSCSASAQAKAECKPGSLRIKATGDLNARAIASLEANLPKIRVLLEARAKLLAANAQTVVQVGGRFTAKGNLSVKATACLIPAVAALSEAAGNVQATGTVSAEFSGAIKLSGLQRPRRGATIDRCVSRARPPCPAGSWPPPSSLQPSRPAGKAWARLLAPRAPAPPAALQGGHQPACSPARPSTNSTAPPATAPPARAPPGPRSRAGPGAKRCSVRPSRPACPRRTPPPARGTAPGM